MKKVKFINSYSFIFSARPGTPAFNLKKIDEKLQKKDYLFFKNCKK
jgi:tRNA A37 methylthiotransferase MiaB